MLPKTMKNIWMRWIMEHHNFNGVILSDNEYNSLSGGTKELIQDHEIASLRYSFPGLPKKPNEKVKPITNDQKLLNEIFNKQAKKLWREARDEVRKRLLEAIVRAEKSNKMNHDERSDESVAKFQKSIERNVLHQLSLVKLAEWVEEDEDKALKEIQQNTKEKREEAKLQHDGWVKKKDRSYIYI